MRANDVFVVTMPLGFCTVKRLIDRRLCAWTNALSRAFHTDIKFPADFLCLDFNSNFV